MLIRIKEGDFSLQGFLYYKKHKRKFTEKSIAKLLLTREGSWCTKLLSRTIIIVLNKQMWVERNGIKVYNVKPETELHENDIIVYPIPMGCIRYKVLRNRLVFE